MLTPKQIQDLADPIEEVYIHMVDELMVNIGKHITSPTWTHTASWEVQKLAELGQLTRENAAIINAWIKKMPAEVRETMEATRAAALDRLEKQLEQAAQSGYITPAITDTTIQVLQDYLRQAEDKFNLVNTTMLQSSINQYVYGIQLTEEEMRRLEAQKQASNEILNEAAANIATGVETRQTAVNRAIRRLSAEGLTGFIDQGGRHWSPEAYVNMVTRTTVHNVAIESTKARMQDYNTQVFQVSSHAAARPLCYPYQGKFLSWDNTEGDIPLGDGSTVHYKPLNSTSYGEAAGLFGINCGHFPIPVIPGVTIPHGADNIQPKEENDREYAESQEQRALERQIREAKRVVEMEGALATKEDKQKVRELQAKMREFTARTGRARRYDRERIVTSGGNSGLSKQENGRKMKMAETGQRRNEEPLTNEQYEHALREVRRHGYTGLVQYGRYQLTGFISFQDGTHFLVIGTDAYPSKTPRNANEALPVNSAMAHEVVGHYETWLRGTIQEERLLDEAQASIRAARFAEGLTDEERDALMQDAYYRLSLYGKALEEVEDLLDIKER